MLTDFGFSKPCHNIGTEISSQKRGTQCYRSPELSRDGKFSFATDMWAFGCVFLEVALTGVRSAFRYDGEGQSYLQNSDKFPRLRWSENKALSMDEITEINRVAEGCLDGDPARRPIAKTLYQHLSNLNWG